MHAVHVVTASGGVFDAREGGLHHDFWFLYVLLFDVFHDKDELFHVQIAFVVRVKVLDKLDN